MGDEVLRIHEAEKIEIDDTSKFYCCQCPEERNGFRRIDTVLRRCKFVISNEGN